MILKSRLPHSQVKVLKLASHGGDSHHGQTPSSAALRAQLRDRIIDRIAELKLKYFDAAEELGLSPVQMSRLRQGKTSSPLTG